MKLHHPHFLPQPDVERRVERALTRGRLGRIEIPIPGIGGSLEVHSETAVAAIAQGSDAAKPRSAAFAEGRALFESLRAGLYEVTLCADLVCDETTRRWRDVEVAVGSGTQLAEE